MAHKKGLGSSRNGRDSNAKRLGVKVFAGEVVTGGEIIVRQRGTSSTRATASGIGRDDTIFAKSAALQQGGDRGTAHARALMATVVAVGPAERLSETEEALQHLASDCAIRAILISQGSVPAPPATVSGQIVGLAGLKPQYVDNAVAALRLSSLPTLVWFRGGSQDLLGELAELADRVVLDEIDPLASWRQSLTLLDRTAFSDLRWARLTRWRTLMAHFFDIPRVRDVARSFTHLHISGSDGAAAKLTRPG